jgi:hypothetical protein
MRMKPRPDEALDHAPPQKGRPLPPVKPQAPPRMQGQSKAQFHK